MKRGDLVTWLRKPRGGYGWTLPTPAVFISQTDKRITIEVNLHSGGCKRVAVKPENVIPREAR